jgi:hypothetical protein
LREIIQPAEAAQAEPEPETEPITPPAPSTFEITPREIQARVRAGAAPEDIAADADAAVEYVMRFAGPVLREREHVADLGRRARLGAASGPAPLLADAVERALVRRGVDLESVAYDAARLDDGTWTVLVTWEETASAARFSAAAGRATWRLDASRQQATPQDDEARRLTARASEDSSDDDTAAGSMDGNPVGDLDHNLDDSVVAPFVPRLALAADVARDAATAEPEAEPERKRDTLVLETNPDTEQPATRHPAGRKGKRASVPAWDDIMFGLRPEDS